MWRAATSVSRAARAAQTHESMPPLSNTIERGFLPAKAAPELMDWIPAHSDGRQYENSCPQTAGTAQNYLKTLRLFHSQGTAPSTQLNSPGRRLPYIFVDLQPQPGVQFVL